MSTLALKRLGVAMERTSLDTADVARLLDKDPKTVARWIRSDNEPRRDALEQVLSLNVVLERLADVMQPGAAQDWLFTPVPALGYQRPADLVRSGEFRPVLALIDALGEGVFT